MKVEKHGDNLIKHFKGKCKCGCEFIADIDEVAVTPICFDTPEGVMEITRDYFANCPECGVKVRVGIILKTK